MNWVFGAYSNVYNTAMMQNRDAVYHLATAKSVTVRTVGLIARLFGRP